MPETDPKSTIGPLAGSTAIPIEHVAEVAGKDPDEITAVPAEAYSPPSIRFSRKLRFRLFLRGRSRSLESREYSRS
jgi:hypothetical protein